LIFGHIGNNHLHANLLPKNEKELALARQTYLELCKNVVAMGGTVSAEHGIGKLKHSSLEILYRKEGLQEMAHLKKALDPHTILGRGNIFPSELL
jgi:D-lactate dehydrogenase (cytochrome)